MQGNAAFKGRQWNKAVNYYSDAIKLTGTNATYYCNRAAAYLELGWYDNFNDFLFENSEELCSLTDFSLLCSFQQAEEDCNQAILLDKKVQTSLLLYYVQIITILVKHVCKDIFSYATAKWEADMQNLKLITSDFRFFITSLLWNT